MSMPNVDQIVCNIFSFTFTTKFGSSSFLSDVSKGGKYEVRLGCSKLSIIWYLCFQWSYWQVFTSIKGSFGQDSIRYGLAHVPSVFHYSDMCFSCFILNFTKFRTYIQIHFYGKSLLIMASIRLMNIRGDTVFVNSCLKNWI